MVTAVTVRFDWPAPSCAALVSLARTRRPGRRSRRPARETRTLTLACLPGSIENPARPRRTLRLAVSFVRPEQRASVPAGQLSLTVTKRPDVVSLVDTSRTPANGVLAGDGDAAGSLPAPAGPVSPAAP